MPVNRVTLTINSRQYTVVAEESKEYIEKLCNHINEKVSEVRKGGQNILGERPVVLAALNICDEYFKAQTEVKRLEEELETYKLQLTRLQNASRLTDPAYNNNRAGAPNNNPNYNNHNKRN